MLRQTIWSPLIKQKKELGYERLISLLSELKNDERLSLLMKLSYNEINTLGRVSQCVFVVNLSVK